MTRPHLYRTLAKPLLFRLDPEQAHHLTMQGAALATTQFMPPGTYSALPDRPVPAADPEGARRLLAEAGYPGGFGLTLIGSNDRYMNDARVVQALGLGAITIEGSASLDSPDAVFQ